MKIETFENENWFEFGECCNFTCTSDPESGLNIIKNHRTENEQKCVERSDKAKAKDPCLAFSSKSN